MRCTANINKDHKASTSYLVSRKTHVTSVVAIGIMTSVTLFLVGCPAKDDSIDVTTTNPKGIVISNATLIDDLIII